MRMLSLAAFAVLALAIGAYEEDEMTLLIGGASVLAAVASLPRWKMSTFLTLLMDLFAAETVLFGLADLVALLGFWPHGYEEYQLPSYLPLATALFMVAIFGVSHIPVVRKIMALADPFFDARTPISIRPWPLGQTIMRQSLYARICVFFLILVNQFQIAIGVRLNFFYRDFGNAIQVPDEESHRIAFWYQLISVFTPLVTISILAFLLEFYVSLNFVLQWRRWMTASYTSRRLMHSMHYKLALNTVPAPTTPTSAPPRTSADLSAAPALQAPTAMTASTITPSPRSRPRPISSRSRSFCGASRRPWTCPFSA